MNKKLIFVSTILAAMAIVGSASAADICPFAKHRIFHRHHVAPTCASKTVVQTPAPQKVEEVPVEHITTVVEKTIVKHVVIEEPTQVVVVRRQCCDSAAPAPRPAMTCCPPGQNIPGLRPCVTPGSASQSSRPSVDKWAQVSACFKGLGLNDGEFFSQPNPDGTDHAKLTKVGFEKMRDAGRLGDVNQCAANVKAAVAMQ